MNDRSVLSGLVGTLSFVEKREMERYCPKCGKKISSDATFCGYCGSKLNEISEDKKKGGSFLSGRMGALIAVAVILAVIIALFIYSDIGRGLFRNKDIPAAAVEFEGHYYLVVDEPMYWGEAKAECENRGGHLITITSKEEQKFVRRLVEESGTSKHYWLGANDWDDEGIWEWVTGEDMEYTHWCSHQPNNNSDDDPMGQDYMELQVTRGDQGDSEYMTWNDICESGVSHVNGVSHEEAPDYCSTKYFGYICEWD